MTAQDEERRAVAYDLHDGLTQFVIASHAHLQSFERAYHKGLNEKAEREIEHSLKLLNDAVVESRRLVNDLRALALKDLGLARAVLGGAAGYILKGVGHDELLDALRRVANGESLLDAQTLTRSLRGLSTDSVGADDLIYPLTKREIEVLSLLATGLSNRDIAPILFIGESTVKTHVEHILGKLGVSDLVQVLGKLGVSDLVQAAVWAARHGLITDDGA